MSNNHQNNIFNKLTTHVEDTTIQEEAIQVENIVQESQDKLEQGNMTNQQKMTQQKDDRNNNSDIIPVKPNSNIMHLNEVMIGVAG